MNTRLSPYLSLAAAMLPFAGLSGLAGLAAQDAAPPQVLVVFDVRDLVAGGATAGLAEASTPADGVAPPQPEVEMETGKVTTAALGRFLQHFSAPAFGTGESLESNRGTLLLRAAPARKAWFSRVLDANRARKSTELRVEVKFLRVDADAFRRHVRPLLAGDKGVALTAAQRNVLLRSVGADPKAAIAAPAITMRPLHTAAWRLMNQTGYVKDFDVEVQATQVVATPVVGVVRDGIHFGCTAGFLAPGELGVDVNLTAIELQRPIGTRQVALGVGAQVTIQLPETTVGKARLRAKLAPGASALLAVPAGKAHLVAIVRAVVPGPPPK